ncbi:MAG: HAD hydrolase-like protein [Acidobacteria bacterium]|nr:HAD hydrolase-like protein [Acidobacteriota bacterium]
MIDTVFLDAGGVLVLHLALEQAGSEAAKTVHVGDLYHVDVAGARGAGLCGAVLVDAAGLYPQVDCPRIGAISDLMICLDRL